MSRQEPAAHAAAPAAHSTEPEGTPAVVLEAKAPAAPESAPGVVPGAPAVAPETAGVPPAAEPAGAWVPHIYTVRVSPRARRASLRMSVDRGLEVVVPRGFRVDRIPELVAKKTAWIERVARRFAAERAAAEKVAPAVRWQDGLPDCIELAAVGEVWAVEYRETASARVRVNVGAWPSGTSENGGGCGRMPPAREVDGSRPSGAGYPEPRRLLLVSGAVCNHDACRAALRRWLSRRADEHLTALLEEVAREQGLSYSKLTVRSQRTRWGSCSSRGAISLNRHLMFLPPQVVRYVLLHELCHMVRSDHSPRFWEEVRRREPEAERLRRQLRLAARWVPGWARRPGAESN